MRDKNIKGIAGILAVTTIGVTGAVLYGQTQTGSGGLAKIGHTLASTRLISGGGIEGISLPALRFNLPEGIQDATDAGKTAFVIAQMLERDHYARTPLNDEISGKFFDAYINALDPQHLYFRKSDIAEFETYRNQLDDLTLKADINPAYAIFDRFKERFQANIAFVGETVKSADSFNFTKDDTFLLDRKEAAFAADEAEQKDLWLKRLRHEYLQEKLNDTKPEEIVKKLNKRYAQLNRVIGEMDREDVEERYLATLMHVYDPHSDYRGRASTENFNISMRLSLVGIGAQLLEDEDGYTKIMELIPGGPAIRSNQIKPGDRIVAVGQGKDGELVDVVGMKVDKVVEKIRGQKGTIVRLVVIPADAPDTSTRKTITLVRDQIKLEESAAKARLIEMPGSDGKTIRLGVVELPSFYADPDKGKSASGDLTILLKKLQEQKVAGVVLDLRRNGGGLLDEAVAVTGLFVKTGPVVQVRDSYGNNEVKADTDPSVAYSGPLVVLTSRLSASASEIVAGALQDYGRAVVIGDASTFGKGTVQAVIGLQPIMKTAPLVTKTDPGSLTLTIQKFYRPSGASTQLEGVKPDIHLPSLTDVLDISEKSLDYPLPYDTINAAPYSKANQVMPFLPELKQRSEARRATDKGFVFLNQQIERTRKAQQEKTVSLNEAKRRTERQEAKARAEKFKKDMASLGESREKIYLLSVAQAMKPGLPPAKTAKQLAQDEKKDAERRVKDPDAEETTEATPELDLLLDESKRILADYVRLTRK